MIKTFKQTTQSMNQQALLRPFYFVIGTYNTTSTAKTN